jgi:putative acetyltransferase
MGTELILQREAPTDPDIAVLMAEREAYLQGLYPDRVGLRRAVELEAKVLGFYGLRSDGEVVGCAGLILHPGFLEAKQVFLTPRARGKGFGRWLMAGLEEQAQRAGFDLLRLEVGVRQPQAFGFYRRLGYAETAAFSPYRPEPTSRFLEKRLGSP